MVKITNYHEKPIEEYNPLQQRFINNNVVAPCNYGTCGDKKCYVDCDKFMDCWGQLEEKLVGGVK